MRLSARARYAVRLMLEVYRLGGGQRPVCLSDVARVTGLSRSFLEQVAAALRNHRLLKSVAGRGGGYSLARDADQISILDVISAVAGPVSFLFCLEDPGRCVHSAYCECRLLGLLLQKRVDALLAEYKLTDLAEKERLERIHRQLAADRQAGWRMLLEANGDSVCPRAAADGPRVCPGNDRPGCGRRPDAFAREGGSWALPHQEQ